MSRMTKSSMVLTMLIFNFCLASYYQPQGIFEHPLTSGRYLPVGYGDSGTVPHMFFLREEQIVDVGILKLFLSREQVDFLDVAQSSPFVSARGIKKPDIDSSKLPERYLWDTILIPVVLRRADR